MPDTDQASLLEIAQKILENETFNSFSEKPKKGLTVFASGMLTGWCISLLLMIFFIKIN